MMMNHRLSYSIGPARRLFFFLSFSKISRSCLVVVSCRVVKEDRGPGFEGT
jgi:hypothetical protein